MAQTKEECLAAKRIAGAIYRKSDAGKAVVQAKDARYRQTETGKAVHRAANARYYQTDLGKTARKVEGARKKQRHPEQIIAGSAVYNAIVAGRLIRRPCEVCGGQKVHGHHDDYSKPLEVRWLCRKHHMEYHR